MDDGSKKGIKNSIQERNVEKMKILMVTRHRKSMSVFRGHNFAEHLAQMGHKVTLI